MANYDVLGNIAIFKFPESTKKEEKLRTAQEFAKMHPKIKTILEKTDKVRGRLRTIKTRHLFGEKNLIADYRESGCSFKFNVETCYFSPRLSNERLQVARMIKNKSKVLIMFAGAGPFVIVASKFSKPAKIVSVEFGKECCMYAKQNLLKNKIYSGVEVIQGDVKKIIPEIAKTKEKFDVILMPRPNLKETFLKEGLMAAKKGTLIVYYGFSPESEKDKMTLNLVKEAKKLKRKIKILRVLEAGDIAPYEHRYRIEIKVGN